jgi:hypothetical protein
MVTDKIVTGKAATGKYVADKAAAGTIVSDKAVSDQAVYGQPRGRRFQGQGPDSPALYRGVWIRLG